MRRISDNQTVAPVSPTQRIRRPSNVTDGRDEPAQPSPRPPADEDPTPEAEDDARSPRGRLIDRFV